MTRLEIPVIVILTLMTTPLAQTRHKSSKNPPGDSRTATISIKTKLLDQLILENQISKMCVERRSAAEVIHVDVDDLNGDGKPEYLVSLGDEAQVACLPEATAWCYREISGGFVRLLTISSERTSNRTFDHFGRKRSSHNGFADLELVTQQGPTIEFSDYVFDGRSYIETKHGAQRVPD